VETRERVVMIAVWMDMCEQIEEREKANDSRHACDNSRAIRFLSAYWKLLPIFLL